MTNKQTEGETDGRSIPRLQAIHQAARLVEETVKSGVAAVERVERAPLHKYIIIAIIYNRLYNFNALMNDG